MLLRSEFFMPPGRPIGFEAAQGAERRREKKRSPGKHGQWNGELILKIWIVFSRAWPVKTRRRGKCCRFYYCAPLNALIGPFSSAALCPTLLLFFSSDRSLHHTHARTRDVKDLDHLGCTCGALSPETLYRSPIRQELERCVR